MATTKVILRRERADNKGFAPLYLRITYQRRSAYISMQLDLPISKWDEMFNRVKPNYPNAQQINTWILKKQLELETEWLKAKRNNATIQVHQLKSRSTEKHP